MRALFDDNAKATFAGHETFPLRLLWLKKAYEAVRHGAHTRTFQEPNAIARFGVGKNMALSMRFWAEASGMITEEGGLLCPTDLGRAVLDDEGVDPYLERAATLWLVHAQLAGNARQASTIYFAFNGLNVPEFDAATLLRSVDDIVRAHPNWRASTGTLKRDIEVLLRTYVARPDGASEDAVEPLLAELGLIREARLGGYFEFVRGPKPSLPDGIFAYALDQFWRRAYGTMPTLSVEQVCYAAGAPGRLFKLDEDSVVTRLRRMDLFTKGAWKWVDTAGLRQLQKTADVNALALLRTAYLAKALA